MTAGWLRYGNPVPTYVLNQAVRLEEIRTIICVTADTSPDFLYEGLNRLRTRDSSDDYSVRTSRVWLKRHIDVAQSG